MLAVTVFLSGFLPGQARAQTNRVAGAIQGIVIDESGGVIPAAAVSVEQPEKGFRRKAVTDSEGRFLIQGLPSDRYTLQIEMAGFGTTLVEDLAVSLGRTVFRQIELKPAALTDSIEVSGRVDAVDITATASSAALGSERIEEGPSVVRNFLNFVLVAPGVALSNGSNAQRSLAGIRSAVPDSGFTFGGMRGRNNGLSIDGVDNRDETTGGNRVAIGIEMVQEFRVMAAPVNAEHSGAAGGSVNVVTRSGNNVWHGDATWFFQNEALNARNPEVTSGVEPRFRRYQPGVSLLGPIKRDQTFFATALEQEEERGQEWSDTPTSAVEAINHALLRPEFEFAPVRATSGLFESDASETEYSLKLNHQASDTHAFSARYAFSRGRISNQVHSLRNFADRSSRGSSLTKDHSFVASLTSVPRPTVVNDLRVQVSRRSVELAPNSQGPMFHIPGVVTLGQAYNLDADRLEDHWELVESVNVVSGPRQLSFGASIHRVGLDSRLANRFSGIFVFPTLDDFAQAKPDVFVQAFGSPRTELSTLPVGFWLQHRWQLHSSLTLDTGVRWDLQNLPGPFADANANIAPRVGIAWAPLPERSLVVRVGGGLFYDRYPFAFLNDAIQKDGFSAFEQYLAGGQAARALVLGRGAPLSSIFDGGPIAEYTAASDFPSTHSQKITAGLEYGLAQETKLSVEYAFVRGFHLPRVRNFRGSLPPVYQLEQTARSSYQGVSISLERPLTRELAFLVTYSYGRAYDDASDFDEHPLDPFDFSKDWALSSQHQAQRFAASGLFELPVEDWRNGPEWLRESLEDVIVSPIFTFGGGRPVNALSTTDVLRTGAFPLSAREPGIGRNPFLGPEIVSLDLRVMKGFWVKEGRSILQVGVEAFNLLNHSNPLRVSPFFSARGNPVGSYGDAVETLNSRQVQLMVQFEY